MNDHDIEATLRATFAGRANTVATGPVWAEGDDAEVLDTQRRRPRRPQRWAPLAAAAAVLLAVGGAIVGAQPLTGRPAATQPPSQPTPVIQRDSCAASLPTTWKSAATAATTNYGKLQLSVAGVTSDGTEIVSYIPPGTPEGTTSLAIGTLPAGSSTPHTLATFSQHTADGVAYDIQVDGNTALISFNFGVGKFVDMAPSEIVVVDTRSGAQTVLWRVHGKHRPAAVAMLFDGDVYWDESPNSGTPRQTVHEYNIASRTDRIVYNGTYLDTAIQESAAGVWWTGSSTAPNVPARLPAAVAEHATSRAALESLTTDGTSYAWRSGDTIGWWAPGEDVVKTHVRSANVTGVAGPLIFFGRAGDGRILRVLDTRTGATTVLEHTELQRTWHGIAYTAPNLRMISTDTTYTITRLDASTLPLLTC